MSATPQTNIAPFNKFDDENWKVETKFDARAFSGFLITKFSFHELR